VSAAIETMRGGAELAPRAPVIELRGVSRRFSRGLDLAAKVVQRLGAPVKEEVVHAVDGVDLSVAKGEVVGLVGESGCGKSTLGRMVAGILPPSEGTILWRGRDLRSLSGAEAREAKLRTQMIFQDPYASLNPRRRVGRIIAEGPVAQGTPAREALEKAKRLLDLVGLQANAAERFPHEFSGGQRQRIGIARALALEPEVLVADEPVSALDVSVQAQVLNLIRDLQRRLGLAILFITHDLRVAAQVCDRIAVMQTGRIVEVERTAELFATPKHPYTRQLLAAIPGASRTGASSAADAVS
jgi:ABC-type oligopeptide transport system ATPase subunit